MRRTAVMVVGLLLVLGACSSGGDDAAEPATNTTRSSTVTTVAASTAGPPAWAVSMGASPAARRAEFNGAEVWIEGGDSRKLFAESCDVARAATEQGAPYGPSERDPETGDFTPGYAYACR